MKCHKYNIDIPDSIEREVRIGLDNYRAKIEVVSCGIALDKGCAWTAYASLVQLNAREVKRSRMPGRDYVVQSENGILLLDEVETIISMSGLRPSAGDVSERLRSTIDEAFSGIHQVYVRKLELIENLGGECQTHDQFGFDPDLDDRLKQRRPSSEERHGRRETAEGFDYSKATGTTEKDVMKNVEEMLKNMGTGGKR